MVLISAAFIRLIKMESKRCGKILQSTNRVVISSFEKVFYKWGCFVAGNPLPIIMASFAVCALCSIGMIDFRSEAELRKNFLGVNSSYNRAARWKEDNFKLGARAHFALLSNDEDVLTPEGLVELLRLHETVKSVGLDGKTYRDFCFKIPITDILLGGDDFVKRRRRQTDEEDYEDYFNFYGGDVEDPAEVEHDDGEDLLEDLPREIYCDLINTLSDKCGEYSILELWKFNEDVIRKLSRQEILDAINTVDVSPQFGYDTDFTTYLGGKTLNGSGHVVSAKSVRSFWITRFDVDLVDLTSEKIGFEYNRADNFTMEWESRMAEALVFLRENITGFELDFMTSRSYQDEGNRPVMFDGLRMAAGYLAMCIYASLVLGKSNALETRFYLANAGILAIMLGVVVSVAFLGPLGLAYTPLSAVLPFLCLGIGIDDMFVIVRAFDNISDEEEDEENQVCRTCKWQFQKSNV